MRAPDAPAVGSSTQITSTTTSNIWLAKKKFFFVALRSTRGRLNLRCRVCLSLSVCLSSPVARGILVVWRPPNAKGPQISLCRLHNLSCPCLAMLQVHYLHKIDLLEVVDKFSKKRLKRHADGQCAAPLTLIYWIIQVLGLTYSTYLLTVQWFSSFYFRTLWMTSV